MSLFTRPRLIGLLLAALIFGADQWIKWTMRWTLSLPDVLQIKVLPFFNFTWAENYGVSMGMFTAQSAEMRYLLILLTGAIALGVLVWMFREKAWGDIGALAMVLGGAAGNIRDRWQYGYVVDYADLHFGDWRPFLIFNLADAAITIGVLIILARSFISREKQGSDAPASES